MALLSDAAPAARRVTGPVLLVVNPASRRGAALLDRAHAAFARARVAVDEVRTAAAGHAASVAAARAADYDAVFTLGGDGTAMEVVGALAGSGVRVGILPGGTGNLVARTLGIPLGVGRAVHALLAGSEARVDLGCLASGQRFAFAAGVGADAQMIARTPAEWKRRLGVLAYALAASDELLLRRERFAVRATVDGRVYERSATAVMVANFGTVLNRLLTLGPGIRQDDGVLDVCVFSPESTEETLHMMLRLFRADFRAVPYMLWVPGREIRIETDPPQPAQADGELLGAGPLDVHVDPLAARLLVPTRFAA
ncbi:MAG TPA: diacylglycerol kinase family protein [Gemmatimonadaceae bacterium]|nr:diacylglycerol kinase family protein [Gemmatimonadaceae bacterium]